MNSPSKYDIWSTESFVLHLLFMGSFGTPAGVYVLHSYRNRHFYFSVLQQVILLVWCINKSRYETMYSLSVNCDKIWCNRKSLLFRNSKLHPFQLHADLRPYYLKLTLFHQSQHNLENKIQTTCKTWTCSVYFILKLKSWTSLISGIIKIILPVIWNDLGKYKVSKAVLWNEWSQIICSIWF